MSSRWMWLQPLGAWISQTLEEIVAQERPFLWHLEVELSPGPGTVGLESDEQGHCPKMGVCYRTAPQKLRWEVWGTWGESQSSPELGGTGDNKTFLMKLLFCPSVSPCQVKECGATIRAGDACAPGPETHGW